MQIRARYDLAAPMHLFGKLRQNDSVAFHLRAAHAGKPLCNLSKGAWGLFSSKAPKSIQTFHPSQQDNYDQFLSAATSKADRGTTSVCVRLLGLGRQLMCDFFSEKQRSTPVADNEKL